MSKKANPVQELFGKTEIAMAKYFFSDKEKQEIGSEMAEAIANKDALTDEMKSIQADYKSRIQIAEASARVASAKLRNGYEMRETECYIEVDTQTRTVSLIHPTTGKTVKTRPANDSDFQNELPLEN